MSIIKPRGYFGGQEVVDAARNHLEPDEVRAFFKTFTPDSASGRTADPYWYGYFRLQFYFGCRVSEPALLLKEDVSFKEKQIVLRRLKKARFAWVQTTGEDGKKKKTMDKTAEPGSGFVEKVYGLPDQLLNDIKGVLRVAPKDNPWLFGSRSAAAIVKINEEANRRTHDTKGKAWRAVGRKAAMDRFIKAAAQAGIAEKFRHSHIFRHTRATLLLASGANEWDVFRLLEHSSIDITRRYLHVAEKLRLRMDTTAALGLGDL